MHLKDAYKVYYKSTKHTPWHVLSFLILAVVSKAVWLLYVHNSKLDILPTATADEDQRTSKYAFNLRGYSRDCLTYCTI